MVYYICCFYNKTEDIMKERFKTFTLLSTSIGRSIRRIKSEEMSEFDLKMGHLSCLYYLQRNNALTLTKLAELCEEDKANLSRSVDFFGKEWVSYRRG